MAGVYEALVQIAAGKDRKRGGGAISGNEARDMSRRALAGVGRGWGAMHGPDGLPEKKIVEADRKCPECREVIPVEDVACKHCGARTWPEDYDSAIDVKNGIITANRLTLKAVADWFDPYIEDAVMNACPIGYDDKPVRQEMDGDSRPWIEEMEALRAQVGVALGEEPEP